MWSGARISHGLSFCLLHTYKKSPSVSSRWRTGRQVWRAHCSLRHSPTRRVADRRHALRPALRLRERPREGAARRALLDHTDHHFQGPLAGTQQIACHFLTTPHTHILSAMPKHAPSHPSLTHAQAACTHSHVGRIHNVDPLHVRALRLFCVLATYHIPPRGVTPPPGVKTSERSKKPLRL